MELMAVAAVVLLFGFASSAPAQRLVSPGVPVPRTPGVSVPVPVAPPNTGVGRVYVPMSSITIPGSAGVIAHTNIEVFVPDGFQPNAITPPFGGFGYNTPASIACRYRVMSGTHQAGCNPNNSLLTNTSGGSGTIAIVDAFDDPWIGEDLNYFMTEFGITGTGTFQVVYASGTEPPFDVPPYDVNGDGGWELEESLDVEYARAMAPNANIVLVEAKSNSYTDLLQAVGVASNEVICGATTCPSGGSGKGEVNMSWGSGEFSGETSYDANFTATNVVYFAASGDSPGVSYPCASPNVVCVGGTTVSKYPSATPGGIAFNNSQEGPWDSSGGGSSIYENIPNYQNVLANTLQALNNSTATTPTGSEYGVGLSTTNRAVPDLAANANPNTGYWVFDSFQFALLGYIPPASDAPDEGGWWIVGGTSAATPVVAGIVNLAGSTNTITSGVTNSGGTFQASSAAELAKIYSNITSAFPGAVNAANFQDVLPGFGVCGPYQGYTAITGWDPCSGIGVPLGVGGL